MDTSFGNIDALYDKLALSGRRIGHEMLNRSDKGGLRASLDAGRDRVKDMEGLDLRRSAYIHRSWECRHQRGQGVSRRHWFTRYQWTRRHGGASAPGLNSHIGNYSCPFPGEPRRRSPQV